MSMQLYIFYINNSKVQVYGAPKSRGLQIMTVPDTRDQMHK